MSEDDNATNTTTDAAGQEPNQAPPSAPAAKPKTIAAEPTPVAPDAVTPKWPENWRQEIAGQDDKELEQLKRYQSPQDIWKKARELEKKVSAGLHAKKPDADATPEQLEAYRKANNIPNSPDKYEAPHGIIVGEADKPVLNEFLKVAHSNNVDQTQAQELQKWYFAERDRQIAEREDTDAQFKTQSMKSLREEWGGEFKQNLNLINALVADTMPDGFEKLLQNGRLADGTVIGNHPEFLKWMAGVARKVNPDAAVLPNFEGNRAQAIDDELTQLTKESGDRSKTSPYWHGPDAQKKQARMLELLTAKEAMKGR